MTMPIPDGSVVITPAQMYQQIGESSKQLEQLANEVRTLRGEIAPAFADLRTDVHDHESTIRALVRDVTIVKTKLNAAWAGIGLLLVALGVVAAFLAIGH